MFIKNELNNHFNDPKKFWDNVTSILPSNTAGSNYIRLRNKDTNDIIEDDKTSEFINDFFSEIGDKLASKINAPWVYHGVTYQQTLQDCNTDIIEVLSLVREIDIVKSSAVEHLSSKILKDAFIALPNILVKMFNASLSTGIVPDSWKHATIIPLKKCGNSTDVNNLRPISLLPVQVKILVKIVHKRILQHMETNDILDPKQGGFRPHHSTSDTITKFSDNIYQQINKGNIVVATYIDLKKAFDTVNHIILLQKLEKIGIKNFNLSWIKNYLTNRSQSTLANGKLSTKRKVSCGVPKDQF